MCIFIYTHTWSANQSSKKKKGESPNKPLIPLS